jgi:long-chain fatty acid transport protein
MTIPQFAVGSSFGLEKTYFALGFHPPFAPRLDYPETGAQRYALQDSLVLQWYAGPSVAHKVLPWLTIGAGVFWSPVNASQTIDLMICQDETPNGETTVCKTDFSDQADPNKAEDDYAAQSDVTVGVDMWDWNNITWNVGLLAEPTDWLAIGVSVLPPMKVSGKGSLAVEFGDEHWMYAPPIEAIDGTSYADQDVVVGLTLPWVVRGGVAVKPTDRIEVELAGTWQRWQMTKEIRVSDVNVVVKDNPDNDINTEDIPITDDVVLPANYVNAWSVHLGGDVDATDWLTVRAGTYYETSAVPGATQTVAVVDGNKIGYGLGATGFLGKHWSIEGAFSQGFIAERNIKDSQAARQEIPVDLLAALNGEIDATLGPGAIVGNGIFSSKMTYISAGLTYYFGK